MTIPTQNFTIAANAATTCAIDLGGNSSCNVILTNTGNNGLLYDPIDSISVGNLTITPKQLKQNETETISFVSGNTFSAMPWPDLTQATTLRAYVLLPQSFSVAGITQIGVNLYGNPSAKLSLTNSGSNPLRYTLDGLMQNANLLLPGAQAVISYSSASNFMAQALPGLNTTLTVIVLPN